MTRGCLLVIEGLEGAGKSTAMLTVQTFLQSKGLSVLTTREPGGTIVGESVRHVLKQEDLQEPLDPRTELLLFYAARVQLIETVIKPALAQGIWVISDRCELSSFAYQGGGRGISYEVLEQLSTLCVGAHHPDLLLYLDISPELGLQRAKIRGNLDRIEQEPLMFFEAVYAAYQKALPRYVSRVVIDASQPLTQVQADLEQTLEHFWISQHARA